MFSRPSSGSPVPEELGNRLSRYRKRSLIVGFGALVLGLAGASWWPEQFYQSYLLGFLFWSGIALGALAIVLLHHVVGGEWGFVSRRPLEAATRTLPLVALLFVPIAVGMGQLYPWADAQAVAADELLRHKAPFLNRGFFLLRAVLYFAVWIGLAHQVNKWSREQDKGQRSWVGRLQLVGGLGLVLLGLTVTFASIDWVMSLEPHWFSTIYGLLFIVGEVLSGFAFAIVVLRLASHYPPLRDRVGAPHFHDLGNLTLAFVLLWAYLGFSQYLLIWSGNLPEEIPWYLARSAGGWQWLALFLVVFHFALPFFLLLSRVRKQRSDRLMRVAVAILVVRVLDYFWLVGPAFSPRLWSVHWMDALVPVGIGGVWLAWFLWQLEALPLLPLNDPRFATTAAREDVLRHGAS